MDTTSSPAAARRRRLSLSARIERLPGVTRSHTAWTAALGLMFLCDIADINGLSFAAPAIRANWSLSISQVGGLTSYTFLGMFVGAVVGTAVGPPGPQANPGRRGDLLLGLLDPVRLRARLPPLRGPAFPHRSGCRPPPSLLVDVTDVPAGIPCRHLSVMIGSVSLGGRSSRSRRGPLPARHRHLALGFVLGAIGLVPGVLVAVLLPESVRWQELRGRADRAEALVARLEADVAARTGQPLPEPEPHTPEPSYRLGDLGGRRYLRRTTVVCLTMAFGMLGYYGFVSWVPTLLVNRGYSTANALTVSTILALAPVVGALAALPIIDRWQRRRSSLVLCVVIAVAMLVFAFTHSYVVLVVAGFCATLLLQTNAALLYAYLPEVFPTALRGMGSGLGNWVGRLAGVAGGFVIAAIVGWGGFGGVFATTAVFVLLSGLVVCLFGQDTRDRGLNDMTLPDGTPAPRAVAIGPKQAV